MMSVELRGELDRARPMIEAALKRQPLFTFVDVESALEDGRAQLFPGQRSAIVTAIEDYPNGERVIDTWLAGGDVTEIAEVMRPRIERWAADNGCTLVTVTGRKGWEKVLEPHGYDHLGTLLGKRIGHINTAKGVAA